jgi:hypothetical protein
MRTLKFLPERENDLAYIMGTFLRQAAGLVTLDRPAGYDFKNGQKEVTVIVGWLMTPETYGELAAEYPSIERLYGMDILTLSPETMNGFLLIISSGDPNNSTGVGLRPDHSITRVIESGGVFTAYEEKETANEEKPKPTKRKPKRQAL